MKQSRFTLEHVRPLTRDAFEMVFSGDASAITAPGQFVNIQLPGKFLRRPIGVCSWAEDALLLIVRAVGEGTRLLTAAAPGTKFDLLTGLGNGFDLQECPPNPILIGGGMGAAPLYALAVKLAERGISPTVALGFRSAEDAFYLEEFVSLGVKLFLATEDGSLGTKGYATDLLKNAPECTYAFACGPTPMLKAAAALPQMQGGQFSLEARMACGFGACVGCSIKTVDGPRRVCKDGPVFRKEALVW